MKANLSNPIFHNEEKARVWLEAERWPHGPVCPFCNSRDHVKILPPARSKASKAHPEGITQNGWYHCNSCRKRFTVRVGTLYERSHIPLHKWLFASHLLSSSKKGMSAHQLWRMLGFGSYRTAWFMAHRIREGMRETNPSPLGGKGKTVEIDESFVGGLEKNKHRRKRKHKGTGGVGKEAVFSLVERGGRVRSHHIPAVNAKTLRPILRAQLHGATFVMTDESGAMKRVGREFARHESVNHSIGEYVRGDAHTNTIEGYFSIMKRGINGVYHHVSQQHLKRYLAEFDFRYNERMKLGVSDSDRTAKAIRGIVGKRLTYRGTYRAAHA
jgi:transposase-like protein